MASGSKVKKSGVSNTKKTAAQKRRATIKRMIGSGNNTDVPF